MIFKELTHIIFDYSDRERPIWQAKYHSAFHSATIVESITEHKANQLIGLFPVEEIDDPYQRTVYRVVQRRSEPSPVDIYLPAGEEVVR